ncbi:MAG: ATP-binding protein [Victivallaceae bacterium]|nr:ATP-binding protein [Victivallaceae bacterium]
MKQSTKFIDRFLSHLDDVDPESRQAGILRVVKERGFLEMVFNNIEEGILVVDRKLRIQYHNQAAKVLLNLPEDLDAVRVSQFLQEVDWPRILSGDQEAFHRVSRQELEILYPVRRFVQFYLVPLEAAASMAAVIIRDVTESHNKTVDAVRDNTAGAIGVLAAQVAHEIGNPLNSLYLNLQLLERAAGGEDSIASADAAEMIRGCKNEVERLDHIILQFLSAIRPGKPQFEPLDLTDLVVNTLNFMRKEIEDRQIEVKCAFPESLPKISGDPEQLRQAFFNIIKNALQATGSGGTLDIECTASPDEIALAFSDSGKGIPPERIKDIFTPFQSYREGGNGIGMMIIERVCREHGAQLNIDSAPGQGTTLTIRFPLHSRRMHVLPE